MQCIRRKQCIEGRNTVGGHVNNWNSGVIVDKYNYYQYQNSCIEQQQDFGTMSQKYLQTSWVSVVQCIRRKQFIKKCSRWIHANNWDSGVIFDEYKYYQYQNSCIEQEQDFGTMSQKYLQTSGGGLFSLFAEKMISL